MYCDIHTFKMKTQKRTRRKTTRSAVSADRKRLPRDLAAQLGEFYRPIKKSVTLRIDADVLAWFKKQGKGYQTRINRALRDLVMKSH